MAAKCPHCGATNPDNLPFCNSCGKPIDRDLQLYMNIRQAAQQQPRKSRYDDDDDDFFFGNDDANSEEDRHPHLILGAVISLCVAAAAFAWLFLR